MRGQRLSAQVWGAALLGVTALAIALRAARWPYRWNQIAFAYAAYQEPFVAAAQAGDWLRAAGTFTGLHPPLYSLIFTGAYLGFSEPAAWLLISLLCSGLAVLLTGVAAWRGFGRPAGVLAASMLAVSLYHNHYSLEVNNYPLLVAVAAAAQLAFVELMLRPAAAPRWPWAVSMALLVWTHVLGALLVVTQAALALVSPQTRRRAVGAALAAAVGVLPLVPTVLNLTGRGSTYHNEVEGVQALLELVVGGMFARFGPPWVVALMFSLAVIGSLRGPGSPRLGAALSLSVLVPAAGVVALTAVGISAAHQHPYYLFLLPGLAALMARGAAAVGGWTPAGPALSALWVTAALLGNLVPGLIELDTAWAAARQARRADHPARDAMAAAQSGAPAAVWLIAPPLQADDNKLAQDIAYAWVPATQPCAFYKPAALRFEFVDYAYGQPFACRHDGAPLPPNDPADGALLPGSHALYTFTDVYPRAMPRIIDHHLSRGQRIEIALYDVQSSPDYLFRLETLLSLVAEGAGAQLSRREVGDGYWLTLTPGGG